MDMWKRIGLCVLVVSCVGICCAQEKLPRAGTVNWEEESAAQQPDPEFSAWRVMCCIDLDIFIPNEDLGKDTLWIIDGIAQNQTGPRLVITLPKAKPTEAKNPR